MKKSNKIISFLLSAIIVVTTFLAVGPVFSVKADAAITINGITQPDINISDYESYRNTYFGGESTNWPTEFVIPGFEYPLTPQSVAYWEKRDWILISAINSNGSGHRVYALDAKSADFVAAFTIWNSGGVYDYLNCMNFSIAVSEHNLYMISNNASTISYFPLSQMDITLNSDVGQNKKNISIAGSINFAEEFNDAPLTYCSVDDGILWLGNSYGVSNITAYNDTYPSALMGYQLKGASSAEEWNNLQGTTDCAGNPTYCVMFKNNLTDIRHASVNNGKVYILRSNSQLDANGSTRSFDIADIDVNAPGSERLTINGVTKNCHIIGDSLTTYNGTQVPEHGEGFCIIEDYLYMFGVQKKGEILSNAPIQVLWKVDQHKLNGVERPDVDADVKASHYEKVTSLSELTGEEEYIIAYKSENKDPVTQKEILYLLDSFGGYGGKKLPRSDGDENTGDSIGVIGYPLSDYSVEDNKLHISDTVDERKSVRWTISHNGSGANLRLKNSDFYYGSYKYLVTHYNDIMMMSDSSNYLSHMKVTSAGNGNFKISYDNYYLWCNDNEYPNITEEYNKYYTNYGNKDYTPAYSGLEEVAGTFHTDGAYYYGLNGGNKADAAVNEKLMQFEIYKRVKDPYASAGEQKVCTDYDVKLNSNGLYDITMESYATAPMQYKEITDSQSKPTDFVFVMDTSNSMQEGFSKYSIRPSSEKFKIDYLVENGDLNGKNVGDWDIDLTDGQDEYIKHSDGTYHPLRMALKRVDGNWRFLLWLYYVVGDQFFVLNNDGTIKYSRAWTESELISTVMNAEESSTSATARSYTDVSGKSNSAILDSGWTGKFDFYIVLQEDNSNYEGDEGRICAAKNFLKNLVDRISADNTAHRIAMCQYTGTPGNTSGYGTGAYTGFFTTSNTNRNTIPSGYNDNSTNYSVAFHSNAYFYNIKNILTKFDSDQTGDGFGYGGGSDLSYGMYMAYKMLDATNIDYTADGPRHACVIVVTDGGVTTDDSQHNLNFAQSPAESAIIHSARIKGMGASVYTVRVGNQDISDFDTGAFLEYLSSNYVYANSLNNVGDVTPTGGDFTYELTVNPDTDWSFSQNLLSNDKATSKHCYFKLDTKSVVREKFDTKVFKYVEDVSSAEAKKVSAFYDALGRLSFDYNSTEAISAIETNWDNGQVNITGFDYSHHYVDEKTATKDGTARKLVITIKNVALNPQYANTEEPTSDYINAQVDVRAESGIYCRQTSNNLYKGFPSERIRIPQYTYVFDYGIRMDDIHINGKIKSIDSEIRYQQYPNPTFDNDKIRIVPTPDGINDTEDLMYAITTEANAAEDAFVLIERPNGDFDWFRLNLVPASTVRFEESAFAQGSGGDTSWTLSGTTTLYVQDLSDANDIYGYDSGYASSSSDFSCGQYYTTALTSEKRRSTTLSTTFTGTGFELYGVCGADTGIQVINVKKDGTTVKAAVVDTFYKDTQNYGTLYQTPIYNLNGLEYGTYTVEVTAAYLPSISGALQQSTLDGKNTVTYDLAGALADIGLDYILEADDIDVEWFDDDSVLNGGTGANDSTAFGTQSVTELKNYVDAIRIFSPASNGDNYYIESEKNARYYNIVDNLLTKEDFIQSTNGFVYVEGNNNVYNADTYKKNGSKHELYLAGTTDSSEALTFKVDGYNSDSRVMLSLRAAYGAPTVKIGGNTINVSSKTEMYYDITDYVNSDGTVTIQNTSAGSLLSVGYLKLTGGSSLQTTSDLSSAIEMIETPLDGEEITTGAITKVEYTPSTDSHNTFDVTVNGRPTMIQFIEEDGGTRTYDRNNKNVTIKSYNADGVEVNSLDRTVAYEVWTINTNLTGPEVKARAKFITDGAYKWDKNPYSFTYEILEPVLDAGLRSITPAAESGKKGAVEVKVVTGPDAQGVRFVMPDGSTCTYNSTKAVTLENGDLEFTGKAWMNEDGLNTISVKVKVNGVWNALDTFDYTVE